MKKAPQKLSAGEVLVADGEYADMIQSLRGIFLDGVQLWIFDFSLREQLQIVPEGALTIDAYRIIGKSFWGSQGPLTLFAVAVERLRNIAA